MKRQHVFLCLCWIIIAISGIGADAVTKAKSGISRIIIRGGCFVEKDSGKPFTPLGVNYYRLGNEKIGRSVHAAFCPPVYDRPYIEKMMKDVASWGFNTVRTFQSYYIGEDGILTSESAREISPAYLSNMLHFLQQAKNNGLHVIFSWDIWVPKSDWWSSMPMPNEARYGFRPDWEEDMGVNDYRIHLGSVRTRANAIKTLIQAIRKKDPSLLPVVLSWELENELYFVTDKAPYNTRQGSFSFKGKTYDLSSDDQVQESMDDIITNWVNACAETIHQADPEALVDAGLFSFVAVGRGGPGTFSKDQTGDNRVPARPMALLRSKMNYVDVHLYAWKTDKESVPEYLKRNLESIEWSKLKPEAKKIGKPIMSGEFGVFANYLRKPDLKIDHELGLECLKQHLQRIKSNGFTGALYWFYGNPDSTTEDECPPLILFPKYAELISYIWKK
jgi:hypothetical protein